MPDVAELVEQGEALVRERKFRKAISCFRRAADLAPEDPSLHNSIGMAEMARRNPARALRAYQRACELAPDIARYYVRRGDALQRLERYAQAVEAYGRALELEPRNAPAWNNRGFANFMLDRWNEAMRCYDEAMRADPTYAVAWYNYGYTLQLSGRLADAKDYYQRAVELDPRDKIAWNNLANVQYNQGEYELSIEFYQKSLDIDPEYVIAVNNIGNALDHLDRYEEAILYHEQALEMDPTFHYAWMAKGRALARLGRPEEGLEFLETALELEDGDPDYHEALARSLLALGRPDEARRTLNLGLAADGQHVMCWVALGDTSRERGETRHALQCYDEAVRAMDNQARNRMRDLDWMEKGKILVNAGMLDEAARQYTNALVAHPESARARFRLAESMLELDRNEQALSLIENALELQPGSRSGRLLLSRAQEWDAARKTLTDLQAEFLDDENIKRQLGLHLASREPEAALVYLSLDDPDLALARCGCLHALDRSREAQAAAEAATALAPSRLEAWLALGWSALENGDAQRASEAFDGALGCGAADPEALAGKAASLEALGKPADELRRLLVETELA
ncbi:MAG: tetratricopeptide repeat protein [Candidatus Poseidoniia archaeon]|jgi:superkiller protein 3|nr:tetratricopeptide repeat protein [Candidatus Poseidoniia archaeon]|tara:strand:- start:4771 stop:6492 length:1722 start_codon:yes stop_codon:yes gene_type:complete